MNHMITFAEIVAAGLNRQDRKLIILARRIELGLDNLVDLAKMGVINISDWYALKDYFHDC